MVDKDDLTRLYEIADDNEACMLDDLRERAGMVWVCSCMWRNHESDETCGGCTSGRRPERGESGTFPRQ